MTDKKPEHPTDQGRGEPRFEVARKRAREIIAARRGAEQVTWVEFAGIDDLITAAKARWERSA